MTKRIAPAIAGLGLSLVSVTSPAKAAAIDSDSVIQRTCQDAAPAQPTVSGGRLAFFLLADAGIQAADPAQQLQDILAGSVRVSAGTLRTLRDGVYRLQQRLGARSAERASEVGLRVEPRGTASDGWWLFQPGVQYICTKFPGARQNEGSGGAGDARSSPMRQLRLRQNPEGLSAVEGQERLAAGAAQVGFRRERRVLDNGTTRTDSTLSIEAALGWALRDREDSALLVYAAYERERLRSTPPPQLAPGASQADKDTDLLELGVTGRQLIRMGGVNAMLRVSGSYISNYVDDSERLRVNLSAPLYFGPHPGGICHFGGFADPIDLGFGPVRGRCSLVLLAQVNHVLDPGSATIGTSDEFILAGGRIGFELAAGETGGVAAGVSYEYQRTLHGNVPSIDRLTAHLKYRIWTSDKSFAVEFGFDFADGINPETFSDENRIRFGVGLIF